MLNGFSFLLVKTHLPTFVVTIIENPQRLSLFICNYMFVFCIFIILTQNTMRDKFLPYPYKGSFVLQISLQISFASFINSDLRPCHPLYYDDNRLIITDQHISKESHTMNHLKLRNSLLLLLTATIWGTSFVAQSVGVESVNPLVFNGARTILAGIALLVVMTVRISGDRELQGQLRRGRRQHLTGGIVCGIILFAASTVQTYGIKYTTVGKSGFITAFYIILVPLFSMLLGKKVSRMIWLAVAIALAGLYLICINESFAISRGDFYVLICAFLFALHIMAVDRYADSVDGIAMSCVQFLTAGTICAIMMLLWVRPDFPALFAAWKPLLYSGVLSAGVGYTLQVVAQKGLHPAVASLLMSMESCISVLSGWVILHEALSPRELAGCGLMFLAIVLADLLPMLTRHA